MGIRWNHGWYQLTCFVPLVKIHWTNIKVTKQNYKVYNKYNITLVFSVLALLFCLSGLRPRQNTGHLNKILVPILKTPGNIVYLFNVSFPGRILPPVHLVLRQISSPSGLVQYTQDI